MGSLDQQIKNATPLGLDIVCGALFDAEIPSTDSNDRNPTQVVHDACAAHGFLAGWQTLSTLYPTVSMNPPLLDDIIRCTEVYRRIKPAAPRAATYFRMTISDNPNELSLDKIPPKVVGGTAWTLNREYEDIRENWLKADFPPMPPAITFGWAGTQRKAISRKDLRDSDTLVLLSTIDYDLDRHKEFYPAFSNAMKVGKRCISKVGTRMQSAALTALLGLDVQVHVRNVQEAWVTQGTPGGNLGPDDISPSDWVATLIGDCGAYNATGYEDKECYAKTRTGIFTAIALANIHDVLYDIASSNRLSSAQYAFAAGVAEFNLHCAFIASMTDAIAHRVLALNDKDVPLFGDNILLVVAAWALFTERYRLWERFIKYIRILKRSSSPMAQNILSMARQQMGLKDCNIDDVDGAWTKAMTKSSETALTPCITTAYPVLAAPEMANIPGHPQPDLCPTCKVRFQEVLLSSTDDFQGILGLPTSVTQCPAVARAATLRRVSVYASDDAACCDPCACKIGRWADAAAYMVCGALMSNESVTNASDWLLQCYAAWAVSLSPISAMTVLSGFDLLCNVKCEDEAMGSRDVLYNWEAK